MNQKPPSPSPSTVILEMDFAATPAQVWRALTDPQLAPLWLGSFRLESSWVEGEALLLVGELEGTKYQESGRILTLEPEVCLRFEHWSPLWGLPRQPENHAVLSFRLEPQSTGTRLGLEHQLPGVEALAEHSRFFWGVSLRALQNRANSGGW